MKKIIRYSLMLLLALALSIVINYKASENIEVHAEEITSLTGTKWLLNETFDKMPNGNNFYSGWGSGCYFTINFISNFNNYTYLGFQDDDYPDWGIEYSPYIFVWSDTWVDSNYRIIEFTGEVTGGSPNMTNSILISWLEANATQIIEPSGYTITYNSNGGSSIPQTSDATQLPNPLPTPTRSGYTFLGWYYDSSFTNAAVAGDPLTSDITLYAKWELNTYKVFEVGDVLPITSRLRISWVGDILDIPHARYIFSLGGNFTIVSKFNDIIKIKGSNMQTWTVIYDGSNFVPPYTNYNGDHAYIEIDTTTWDINRRTISGVDTGMDIFTWEDLNAPTGFNITFEENGGTTQTDLTEQTNLPNPLPIPTKSGYTFLGWYYDSDFTNEAFADDPLTGDVTLYAKWELNTYKVFEVGDVLPPTQRLRISWVGDILDIPHARYIFSLGGYFTIVSKFDDIIKIKDSNMDTWTVIYDGSSFIPPYTNYDGDHAYIEIDTSTWDINRRTISGVDTGMDIFTWEDMYANFQEGYLTAREEYGYYDPITNQWLSVDEYLDLYGTDKPGQSDFYANFDKYFIPAMIIVFGGAIVLTVLKVFKGRE